MGRMPPAPKATCWKFSRSSSPASAPMGEGFPRDDVRNHALGIETSEIRRTRVVHQPGLAIVLECRIESAERDIVVPRPAKCSIRARAPWLPPFPCRRSRNSEGVDMPVQNFPVRGVESRILTPLSMILRTLLPFLDGKDHRSLWRTVAELP